MAAHSRRGEAVTINRMNHAVLYVRDAARTSRFYTDVLGFHPVSVDEDGRYAFLRAPGSENHHDIAFFTVGAQAGPPTEGRFVGLYHIAWEVTSIDDLAALRTRLREAGSLVGASDHGVSKSLYAKDPDGIEFEVMWSVPKEQWGEAEHSAVTERLDLDAEVARYGTG
jgi:catechol-2,3-dioxygenase